MMPDDVCTCGHLFREHRLDAGGVQECEFDECDCQQFTWGEGDDDDGIEE